MEEGGKEVPQRQGQSTSPRMALKTEEGAASRDTGVGEARETDAPASGPQKERSPADTSLLAHETVFAHPTDRTRR